MDSEWLDVWRVCDSGRGSRRRTRCWVKVGVGRMMRPADVVPGDIVSPGRTALTLQPLATRTGNARSKGFSHTTYACIMHMHVSSFAYARVYNADVVRPGSLNQMCGQSLGEQRCCSAGKDYLKKTVLKLCLRGVRNKELLTDSGFMFQAKVLDADFSTFNHAFWFLKWHDMTWCW